MRLPMNNAWIKVNGSYIWCSVRYERVEPQQDDAVQASTALANGRRASSTASAPMLSVQQRSESVSGADSDAGGSEQAYSYNMAMIYPVYPCVICDDMFHAYAYEGNHAYINPLCCDPSFRKRAKCTLCKHDFWDTPQLIRHFCQQHLDTICKASGVSYGEVSEEVVINTRVKTRPFACGKCGLSFEFIKYLDSHLQGIHPSGSNEIKGDAESAFSSLPAFKDNVGGDAFLPVERSEAPSPPLPSPFDASDLEAEVRDYV